jgi:GntR family transcriptional regulator
MTVAVKLCYVRLRVSVYYGTMSPMASPSSSAGRPVYLKLRDQIAAAILDGTFAEGAMLPSVRAYAAAEAANPLTVAKAYQQFQAEGLVQVQRGVGMFVAPGAREALRARERAAFLRHEWPEIRARMRRLHLDPAQLLGKPESVIG